MMVITHRRNLLLQLLQVPTSRPKGEGHPCYAIELLRMLMLEFTFLEQGREGFASSLVRS